jgi:hypothetical protein
LNSSISHSCGNTALLYFSTVVKTTLQHAAAVPVACYRGNVRFSFLVNEISRSLRQPTQASLQNMMSV